MADSAISGNSQMNGTVRRVGEPRLSIGRTAHQPWQRQSNRRESIAGLLALLASLVGYPVNAPRKGSFFG